MNIKTSLVYFLLYCFAAVTYPSGALAVLDDISQVVVGAGFTCARDTTKTVRCWGHNVTGQLGDGTTTDRSSPMPVSGLSNVIVIAAGNEHACAVLNGGSVKCWGANSSGQLGDGTTTVRRVPVDVLGLDSGVASIAAGARHTCAILETGGMKCWGKNDYGQLGDGTTTMRTTPVDVSGLGETVISASGLADTTCAHLTGGIVKCWGRNNYGQLGLGFSNTNPSPNPTQVQGLEVTSLVTGDGHACVITVDQGVKCWGYNIGGVLGVESSDSFVLVPTPVTGLSTGVIALASGDGKCALVTDGPVKCWGRNLHGRVGDGTTTDRQEPVNVSGLSSADVASIATYNHTCALLTNGDVKCWGENANGQVGDRTNVDRLTPVDVLSSHTLGGIVTVNGAGLAGVTLSDSVLGVQTTDSSGNYSFGTLPDGTTYNLTLTKAGYGFTPESQGGTISHDVIANFTASLTTHTLSGSISDHAGPVSNVSVTIPGMGTRLTDSEGQYSFSGIPYGTSYTVTPQKTGYTFNPSSRSGTVTTSGSADFLPR